MPRVIADKIAAFSAAGVMSCCLASFLISTELLGRGDFLFGSTTVSRVRISFSVAACFLALGCLFVLTGRCRHLRLRLKNAEDHDALTGAASRTAFLVYLKRETPRCRQRRTPISIAVLDCDSFKKVNDAFGHCVGDDVLRATASVLLSATGDRGLVARLWGDAFVIVYPGRGFDSTRAALEQAQQKLAAAMASHDWPVTFSIGAATFDHPPESTLELLQAADAMMYSVKKRGRNGIACSLRERGNEAVTKDAEECVGDPKTPISAAKSDRQSTPHHPNTDNID